MKIFHLRWMKCWFGRLSHATLGNPWLLSPSSLSFYTMEVTFKVDIIKWQLMGGKDLPVNNQCLHKWPLHLTYMYLIRLFHRRSSIRLRVWRRKLSEEAISSSIKASRFETAIRSLWLDKRCKELYHIGPITQFSYRPVVLISMLVLNLKVTLILELVKSPNWTEEMGRARTQYAQKQWSLI